MIMFPVNVKDENGEDRTEFGMWEEFEEQIKRELKGCMTPQQLNEYLAEKRNEYERAANGHQIRV